MVVHGRCTRPCVMCTPLHSKTIRNSRVLGYGQLNGHVASIMSMFSNGSMDLEINVVPGRYLEKLIMYMGGTDVEMPDDEFFQEVLQRKFLSYLSFNKRRGTVISTREKIGRASCRERV